MIRLPILALSTACALLCGCLVTLHPLSSPSAAAPDARLFGVWVAHEPGEDLAYLHVGAGKNGMTEALMIEHGDDGRYQVSRYSAFPTQAGAMTLLNVVSHEDRKVSKGYDIVWYRIDGSTLSLAAMSEDAVKQDIRDGKVKGKVDPGALGDTTITASGKELLAYVASADPARLFPKALTFRRAADPGGK